MTEKLKDVLCCGLPANIEREAMVNNDGAEVHGVGVWCEAGCGNQCFEPEADGAEERAIDTFKNGAKDAPKKTEKPTNKKKETKPKVNNQNQNNQLAVRKDIFNTTHLAKIASPIIAGETGAVERLINNNVRYVENSSALEKVWCSEEGKASIVYSTEEAMIMGIELGKMGDLVPYGSVCQLIPSVEAYKFVLTNGSNSPFTDLGIECVYENDICNRWVKKGSFDFEIKHGTPRGEIIGVVVWADRKNGKTIGDYFDADRLMEKAEAHSVSYQRYLQDVAAFEAMSAEKKTGVENGREYFMKQMFKKGGGTWEKKVFRDELKNPYDGPDKPEMLRKSAGKSFLAPYMKVRNSEAAMAEARSSEEARDRALDMADTIDGEIEEV